jgi:hypothetical protein
MVLDEILLFFLLVFWLAGTLLLSAGIFTTLQLVQLKRRGSVSVGDVADGEVTTRGRVDPTDDHGIVDSPVTGAETLCYEYLLQRQDGTSNRVDWETIGEGRDGVFFAVSDDTGGVLVEPNEARLELDPDDVLEFEASEAGIEAASSELATCELRDGILDVGIAELELGDTYRILERRIQQGDSVTLTGYASTDAVGDDLGLTGPAAVVGARTDRGPLQQYLGVPYTLTDEDQTRARTTLFNRAIVLVTFGVPLFLFPVMFLFPPTG